MLSTNQVYNQFWWLLTFSVHLLQDRSQARRCVQEDGGFDSWICGCWHCQCLQWGLGENGCKSVYDFMIADVCPAWVTNPIPRLPSSQHAAAPQRCPWKILNGPPSGSSVDCLRAMAKWDTKVPKVPNESVTFRISINVIRSNWTIPMRKFHIIFFIC